MARASKDSISVIVLDADERFCTLLSHHITTVWPAANVLGLASLAELDVSISPDCFILDHETLQKDADVAGATIWFQATAVIASSPCIVVAEPSDELLAVRYMKGGARDYLPKRLIKHDLIIASIRECVSTPKVVASETTDDDQAQATSPQETAADTGFTRDTMASTSRHAEEYVDKSGDTPKVDGYRILRPIAKGGVASVYLAHSEKLGHEVALKIMRASKSNARNKLYERFRQEYHLVSNIDSASVVKTYDFGHTEKEVYIAFQHYPRGDLRVRLRDPMDTDEAVAYVHKIALALQELHALGIYHRDLKPGNIMLGEEDSIALIDFGMAKQLQSTEKLTLPGTVQGTPHYLSPEQAKGKPVDQRSDIYSLGVLFFEMLEGRKPYTAKTALEVSMSHIMDPVPKLSPHNAGYQKTIDWMMAKDIDQRCPNVDELVKALESEVAGAHAEALVSLLEY